jgi:hypothetical protein
MTKTPGEFEPPKPITKRSAMRVGHFAELMPKRQ